MKKSKINIKYRIRLALVLLILALCVVTLRYAWIQVVQGDVYAELLRHQVGGEFQIQSLRGAILDRNGRELAISTMTNSLFIDPNNVPDAEAVASDIAPLIGVPKEEILEKIADGGGFAWLKRRMEQEEYEKVRALIREKEYQTCLGFREEAKRYYPNDSLAAHVLGFVGTDDVGLEGIENTLDSVMKGEVTEEFLYTDHSDKPILESVFVRRRYAGDRCKTVQLTLDSVMQFAVEQELDRTMAETRPQAITCIVMDPKTGDILALASRPTYNPNKFWEYNDEDRKNIAVASVYEPGSTFKSIIAGAAMQEKLVAPNDVFVDPGYVMVSGRRIQNWNNASFGTITFTDVVKQSLNTGFAQVGLKLGAENLLKYAKLFGFGEVSGINLPGELDGILFEADKMVDSDMATMAIGQSIAVTPLQLVTAMAAIANDGILLKPHIVKKVMNADGTLYMDYPKTEVRRALESATDKALVGLLEQVVASGGGNKAGVKGYRIAGKTGTAQKIRKGGSGYLDDHYIASFCGFGPVEDPQFVVLVVIDDPLGQFYGGQIAAPVASRIFSQLFRYRQVKPSSDPGIQEDEEKAEQEKPQPVKRSKRRPVYEGVVPQGKTVVPDLYGKSIREAAQAASDAGLTFVSEGSGFAESQSIEANTLVNYGTNIKVKFSP